MALPTLVSLHAYVLNRHNGQELYALDENTSARIASITKTFCMGKIVRELYPTQAEMEAISVTVDADDEAVGGTGDSAINEGDIWNAYQLCQAAWLPSSNEATYALARNVSIANLGGSGTAREVTDTFVTAMNTEGTASGLTATTYTTVHGAPGTPGSTGTLESSTAKEQAIVFDQVCDWPVLRSIMADSNPTLTITRGGVPFETGLSSGLTILGDTGVIGAKGGSGGGNHLETLWQAPNGNEIVIVTLRGGSDPADREADHRAIIAQLPIDYPYLASQVSGSAIP